MGVDSGHMSRILSQSASLSNSFVLIQILVLHSKQPLQFC